MKQIQAKKQNIVLLSIIGILVMVSLSPSAKAKGGSIELAAIIDEIEQTGELTRLSSNTEIISSDVIHVTFGDYEDMQLPISIQKRFIVRQLVLIAQEDINVGALYSSVIKRSPGEIILETNLAYSVKGISGTKTSYSQSFVDPVITSNRETSNEGITYLMDQIPESIEVSLESERAIFEEGDSGTKTIAHTEYEIVQGERKLAVTYLIDVTFSGKIVGDFTFDEQDLTLKLTQQGDSQLDDLIGLFNENTLLLIGFIAIMIGITLVVLMVIIRVSGAKRSKRKR